MLDPAVFRFVSVGNAGAWTDWLWISALQDDGPAIHWAPNEHPESYYQLSLITELDPFFRASYTSGAHLLAIVRNDGRGARDLLMKGEQFQDRNLPTFTPEYRARNWPNPWSIPLLLAYVDLFELSNLPAAAGQFRAAANYPNAPPYLRGLAHRLEQPGGNYEVGLQLLRFMLYTQGERDTPARRELSRKYASLEVLAFLDQLNRQFGPARSAMGAVAPADAWRAFRRKKNIAANDPWGGKLFVDDEGRVQTTTPHEPVFGLGDAPGGHVE